MVEVDVQRRHLQIVVLVLGLGDAPAEVARLVVVDVGQGGDTETAGVLLLLLNVEPLTRLGVAQRLRGRLDRCLGTPEPLRRRL